MAVLESYSESNQNNWWSCNDTTNQIGQSFNGVAGSLTSARFYLKTTGSPVGNCSAILYAHTGSFGGGGTPTGSALAVSGDVDVTTIGSSFVLVTFTFSGFTLVAGTKYCVTVFYNNGDASNTLDVGTDSSAPSHAGNLVYFTVSWNGYTDDDACFYVEGTASGGGAVLPVFRNHYKNQGIM